MAKVDLFDFAVHLRPQDNVAVVTKPIAAGMTLSKNGTTLSVSNRIGMGHKVALAPISKGAAVYKYGQIISFASKDIAPGDWVHVHNVSAELFERDYAFCKDTPPPPALAKPRTFQGYDRGTDRAEPYRYGT